MTYIKFSTQSNSKRSQKILGGLKVWSGYATLYVDHKYVMRKFSGKTCMSQEEAIEEAKKLTFDGYENF